MDTIAIVLIVIAVLAVLAILYFTVFSPKKRAEKRLRGEREQAATRHRELASERQSHASVAEQQAEEARVKAQRAEHEAELARQEATVHEGRADLHEQGLADHELEHGEASTNGHRTENIDRSGHDEETTHARPASLSDRDREREQSAVPPEGETRESGEPRRDAPAERW